MSRQTERLTPEDREMIRRRPDVARGGYAYVPAMLVLSLLDDADELDAARRWRDAKAEKPTEGRRVLAVWGDEEAFEPSVVAWERGGWADVSREDSRPISKPDWWMEFPEPPKL